MSRKSANDVMIEEGEAVPPVTNEVKKGKPKRKRVADTSNNVWLTKAQTAKMVGMSVKVFNQNAEKFAGIRTMKVGNRTAYFKESVQSWLAKSAESN